MSSSQVEAPAPALALAVCRESLGDNHEWSIFAINSASHSLDVLVERADLEWGDMGHEIKPGTSLSLLSGCAARILRVDGMYAELSMCIDLLLTANGARYRTSFELGKLCRYRNSAPVEALGLDGWLRTPTSCRSI